jgi:exonuclease VII large subunit
MKRTIITSALILCSIIGFSQQRPAQNPNPPTAEQIAQREANALSQRLSLTEEQRSKAYSIYLEKAKKDLAAREARMKEMEKQREIAAAAEKQQSDKISQLLNTDQKKTFEEMQTRRDRMSRPGAPQMRQGAPQQGFQRGPGGQVQRPGGPGQRMQPGQERQLQRPNMPPNFQRRPGGPGNFQQGRPGVQNFRRDFPERFRMERFRNRSFRPQGQPAEPQNVPENRPATPSN